MHFIDHLISLKDVYYENVKGIGAAVFDCTKRFQNMSVSIKYRKQLDSTYCNECLQSPMIVLHKKLWTFVLYVCYFDLFFRCSINRLNLIHDDI
jgi:hypothetical protein